MKRLSKICCGGGHTDADVEEPRFIRRLDLQSRPIREVLRVRKVENAFSVAKARFSLTGDLHGVVINLDKQNGTKMELIIDGVPCYEADTKDITRGNAELHIDRMAVDFVWELVPLPNFAFFTREAGDGSSSSSAGEAKRWEDHEHVYLLQILEDELV